MGIAVASKALAIWAGILILAILNGVLRESLLVPRLGMVAGLASSGVLLSILILAVAYLSVPWIGAKRPRELAGVGLGWFVLTLLFEFALGLSQGKSWQVMLEAYTLQGGNLWPAVLMVTALAPYLGARLRSLT